MAEARKNNGHRVESVAEILRENKPREQKYHSNRHRASPPPSGEIWTAYAQAYASRYGVPPVRNPKINGQITQLLARLGAEAKHVAGFYLQHNARRYVECKHPVGMLLKDAEGLRTEWATKTTITETQARRADRTQATANVFLPLIEEARAREKQSADQAQRDARNDEDRNGAENAENEFSSDARFAIPLDDAMRDSGSPEMLVEKLIPSASLGVMVGEEGVRKSFLGLDAGLSVATGEPFHDLKVKPGKVLFIAGEGRAGVLRRAQAWLAFHKKPCPANFYVNLESADLLDEVGAERVLSFAQSVLGLNERFGLIIVDTLARAMPGGNENGVEDMGKVIANADTIRQETGATVLLITHTPLEVRGKGKPRPRGHSSLSGAIDTGMAVEFDPESEIATLSVIKQKDDEAIAPLRFRFVKMDLGTRDNFGNAVTTVVPRPTEDLPKSKRKLGRAQQTIVGILERAVEPLLTAEVLARAKHRGISRSGFYTAVTALLDHGLIRLDDEKLQIL